MKEEEEEEEEEEERKVIQSKIREEGKLFGLFSMWLPGLSRQLRARPQEHRCSAKLQSHPSLSSDGALGPGARRPGGMYQRTLALAAGFLVRSPRRPAACDRVTVA